MLNEKMADDLKDSQGKKVLIHYDFNVPLKEGVIQSYNHIDGAIPTIKKLLDQDARAILRSHLGKPKGKPIPGMGLAPVVPALSERLDVEVKFVDDPRVIGSETRRIATELKGGEVLLLQNTRHKGEEAKFKNGDAASEAYVKELANLCNDTFVSDAFGTIHGVHCFNIDVTRFTKENVVDYLVEKGIKLLGQAIENPVHPFVTILGGTKVSDKINVINNLLDEADTLIINGGMAYTLAKIRGQGIGNSLCEIDKLDYALEIIRKAGEEGVRLPLPIDYVEGKEFPNDTEHKVVDVTDAGWSESDIGPKTIALYKEALQSTKTVVWNGPMGVFELFNFAEDTLEICRTVADPADTTTAIDGDGSVNAMKRLDFADETAHIFTGGGASLEFLEGKELPGVAIVDNKA